MAIGENQPRKTAGEATHRLVPLKENDPTTLVARSKVVSSRVELDGGYDVG